MLSWVLFAIQYRSLLFFFKSLHYDIIEEIIGKENLHIIMYSLKFHKEG